MAHVSKGAVTQVPIEYKNCKKFFFEYCGFTFGDDRSIIGNISLQLYTIVNSSRLKNSSIGYTLGVQIVHSIGHSQLKTSILLSEKMMCLLSELRLICKRKTIKHRHYKIDLNIWIDSERHPAVNRFECWTFSTASGKKKRHFWQVFLVTSICTERKQLRTRFGDLPHLNSTLALGQRLDEP